MINPTRLAWHRVSEDVVEVRATSGPGSLQFVEIEVFSNISRSLTSLDPEAAAAVRDALTKWLESL